jgi:hypothetical protein
MRLMLFMCSQFQGKKDVVRLMEIVREKGLLLTRDKVSMPGRGLVQIPYEGEISALLDNSYRNYEFVNASEIVNSSGPSFYFEAITKLKYQDFNTPKPENIMLVCGGLMLGQSYNSVDVFTNFRTPDAPDHKSPNFELAIQLLLGLSLEFYGYLKPWYGWMDYDQNDFLSQEAIRDRKELNTLHWANFIGPQYVEKFGSNLFLDAPIWKKEKLADGGIFLQQNEFYTKPVSGEEKRKLQEYFLSFGIKLTSGNPFDEDYQEN